MNKFNKQTQTNNIWKLFQLIQDHGAISRAQIKEESGLSWGTVSSVINKLEKKGFIEENPIESNKVGRKKGLITIANNSNFVLGIDINVSGLTFIVTDLKWEVHQIVQGSILDFDKDSIIEQILQTSEELIKKFSNFLFVAISLQGRISRKKDVSREISGFSNWKDIPIKSLFEKKFGIPTFLYHDPDCLLAFHKINNDIQIKNKGHYALIKIDNSIGISLLLDDVVFEDSNGRCPEIAHSIVEYDGEPCYCGKKGCLESYISINGLTNLYNKKYNKSLSIKDYCQLLNKKDEKASELLLNNSKYLAATISNLFQLFSPQQLIIGGKLAKYADIYMPFIKEYLKNNGENHSKLVVGEYKLEACALGACVLTINNNFKSLIKE